MANEENIEDVDDLSYYVNDYIRLTSEDNSTQEEIDDISGYVSVDPGDTKDPITLNVDVYDGLTINNSTSTTVPVTSDQTLPESPIDTMSYRTEYITMRYVLDRYDIEYLEYLDSIGATFYAVLDDNTEVEIDYNDIIPPYAERLEEVVRYDDIISETIGMNFWNDTNGVHVAQVEKDEWTQAVSDNFSDMSLEKTYHNILLNSEGILLRRALMNLFGISRLAISFYDGTGNTSDNITATFGSTMAQIGKTKSNHVVITSNGVTAYKGDGTLDELTAIIDGANLKNATITGSKIASSTIENSNIKDGTITGAKIQGSTLTDIPYAEIDELKTRNISASSIEAATGFVSTLSTNNIGAAKIVANQGIIDNLETNFAHITNGVIDNAHIKVANVDDLSANYAHITNGVIDNAEIDHADVNGLSANYAHITNGVIDNAKIGHADVNGLSANYATIANLNASSGRIDDLEADHVSTSDLAAETARIDTLVTNTADIATIRANSAKVANLTAAELEADHATVGSLDTNYAQIDMANVNNAWITNGTIKDAAISDGMINSVSANKLTAGTIDASNITVTNLNADNITTGTINGQRIGQGSLSLDKLSEDVYTETEVDGIVQNLQTQIDGAIETWTGTTIPTLQNAPASSWTTNSVKDTHVGDVYFIVNSQSNQNGYNYRFTKSGNGASATYSWQLIKDSDVTNALQRLTTAEGKITTFDSDISQLKTDTSTLTTKTTSLETRMSNAEADILDKVDTTTFNEVSDTVDSHSQSITQMTTALSNKADSSTVSSLTTRVSKNEQDISGINSTIGILETTVESKADGSTVETISSKVNTISDTVDGHTQNIYSIVSTQTQINHELDKTIVETVRLYTVRSSNDIPSLPTTPILSETDLSDVYLDNTGNELLDSNNNPIGSDVWSITKPSYNSNKPNYFYCYQNKHVDGSYTWSNVVRDNATTESQNLGHVASESLTTVTTKVNNISDTVDGHTQSISSITSTQTTMQGQLDKTIVETTQLWFSKADTTVPSKPTVQITSTSTDGNAWRIVVPEYNASYPNYYYCYQWKYSDGTYGWSSVTRDIATGESQERARTAIANASTADDKAVAAQNTANSAVSAASTADGKAVAAQNTANKNVKESVQLWCTKASNTAPSKPTAAVTSTATTGNAWTTKVPAYNSSYPYYFYCVQYKLADGTYTWSDVVYDQATTETQSVSRTTSSNLSTLQQDYATFKQTTQQFESTVGTTYATKTELKTTDDKIENLEIGGRNLLYKTVIAQGRTSSNGTYGIILNASEDADTYFSLYTRDRLIEGQTYTLSCEASGISDSSVYYNFPLFRQGSTINGLKINKNGINSFTFVMNATELTQHSAKVVDGITVYKMMMDDAGRNIQNQSGPITITKFKLEKGAKATDWTPAPEDVDAAIVAVESRVSNAETSITQTNNQIALKANASDVYTKTQTDGLISTEVTNRNSAINQKADAITASVASTYTTKTEFNNLEIGGRNLYIRSTSIPGYLYTSGIGVEPPSTLQERTSDFIPVVAGESYILQTWYDRPEGDTTNYQWICLSTYNASKTHVGQIIREHLYYPVDYKLYNITLNAYVAYVRISARRQENTDWIQRVKFEKGTKPTDWTPAPEDLEAYTDSQVNSAKSEIKVTTDNITSEVSKISSAKYVTSATASWSLPNIKTWAAEGYTGTWSITSSANLRVGDTVYIKGTDSTRNCSVYIKVTVTGITSNASITGISHGYEDILPVETIKSTINQSSDSVKIQAKHIDIDGAAIFSSGRLSPEALNDTYDKKGTAEKVVSDFDKQIIDKLDNSIIETIQLWMISSTQSIPTKPLTPVFTNAELSDAYLDSSGNTILDSSGNAINSITWTTIKPSYDLKKPYYYYCYQYKHYDGSYTWSDVYKDNALSSAASESVSEEQYIYISKVSGTNSLASNTTWVTVNSDSQNTWTTKRPTYNSSYPVLFVAKQRKTVSGVVTCTTPVKDDTTTIIDGGHITTGIIDASKVTVTNLDASEIKTGSLAADRIKANVISAVNNGTGTINADKINVSNLSIGYNQLTDTPTIPTKVSQLSNDSDFVNADQLSTVIDGQNSVSDRINESIVNTKILYTTRDVSTIPNAPNTPITLDSDVSGAYLDSSSNLLLDSNGNAIMSKTWTVFRPSYSQEEPYYFYCYQYEHSDGSYTWSNVMRDDATNESFKILSSRVEIVCSSINYNNSTANLLAKLYVNNVETSGNQYQWFKDGVALANQTNQILLVTSSMGINHLYSCTVDY